MSKESRRRQRTASQSPTPSSSSSHPTSGRPAASAGSSAGSSSGSSDAANAGTGANVGTGASGSSGPGTPRQPSGRPSTSPTGSVRVGRRERARSSTVKASFLERNRTILLGLAIVAIVGVVGVGLFSAATQPVYACSTLWEPNPTQSPAAGASPQPGYAEPDMGNEHLANGTQVTYTYCPPASGKHFNGTATGPITARVYSPTDAVNPQGWIHNLEHGALVVLYRGDSEGATEAGQAAMRAFFDRYPVSPICGFQPGTSVGPAFVRFDEMATPFAALVWGRVLPLQSLDEAAILQLDVTYGERTNPEKLCAPSPSPSAPGSAAPSGSSAPSAAPSASASPKAPGPSATPNSSASASSSPDPGGSTAPSPGAS